MVCFAVLAPKTDPPQKWTGNFYHLYDADAEVGMRLGLQVRAMALLPGNLQGAPRAAPVITPACLAAQETRAGQQRANMACVGVTLSAFPQ